MSGVNLCSNRWADQKNCWWCGFEQRSSDHIAIFKKTVHWKCKSVTNCSMLCLDEWIIVFVAVGMWLYTLQVTTVRWHHVPSISQSRRPIKGCQAWLAWLCWLWSIWRHQWPTTFTFLSWQFSTSSSRCWLENTNCRVGISCLYDCKWWRHWQVYAVSTYRMYVK